MAGILIIGIAGFVALICAWAVLYTDPKRYVRMNGLYMVGAIFLTLYSITIGDALFTVLNMAACAFSALSLHKQIQVQKLGSGVRAGRGQPAPGNAQHPAEVVS